MDEHGGRSDAPRWPVRLLAVAVGLLVAGPALGPGFVLVNDMVFVPRQYLSADALGLGSALPRAVPADAVLAVVTAVLPGDLVQKLVLALLVTAAVLGAARLAERVTGGVAGPAVAGLVYGWSPFVAERLLMGHWSLLIGYAALPWVARAALDLRAGRPGAPARLVLAMAAAALAVTGGVLATAVAVVLGGRRGLGWTVGAGAVLAAPWVVAGLLHPGGGDSDPAGVAAFAARGENWAGPVLAVLGGGGIWNGAAVPGSRASVLAPLVTVLLVALAAVGWRTVAAGLGRRAACGLAGLGVAGVVLAVAGVVPGLRELSAWTVSVVPGAGLLRDGQKWAAWWALALAVGAGAGAVRLARLVEGTGDDPGAAEPRRSLPQARSRWAVFGVLGGLPRAAAARGGRGGAQPASGARWCPCHDPGQGARRTAERGPDPGSGRVSSTPSTHGDRHVAARAVVATALLLPVIAVPDLAWGVGGRLTPVAYPDDWDRVRAVLAEDPRPGAVLALPFGAVRSFAWNAGRPQLDPAPRYLPRPVVVDDTLVVGGSDGTPIAVAGEDARSRAVAQRLDDPAGLAAAGVGWVLVEHGTPGAGPAPAVAALPRVADGPWLTLLRVPGPVAEQPAAPVGAWIAVVAANLAVLVAVLVAAVARCSPLSSGLRGVTVTRRRQRRESG